MSQTAQQNLRRYEYSEDLLAGSYKGKILSNLLILVLWQLSELLNLQVYKKATAYLGSWIELSTVGDKKTNLHNNQTICADIFMPRGALFMRTKAKENIPIPGIIPCFSR